MYIELKKNASGKWYLTLKENNGETVAVTEDYASKWNANRAAKNNFPGVEVREK